MLRGSRTTLACLVCASDLTVELFPAVARERVPEQQPADLSTDHASCYEHPSKPAKAFCHRCGRFLCALCEVEMSGTIWCPSCLQVDSPKARPQTIERSRTLFDSIALFLSTWSVLFFYPIFFAPPIVFYLAIRYWKTPSSIIPRSRWRFGVALAFATIELCFVGIMIFSVIMAFRTRGLAPPRP